METFKIFCAGEFISGEKELVVTNKYTGKPFALTWQAGRKTLDKAITGAQAALTPLKEMSSGERSAALKYISEEIQKNKTRLAEILSAESAKPMMYAAVEITRAAHTFMIASEECKRFPNEYISLDWTSAGRNREGLVKYFPVGIVAGISPFNFPLNLAVHKIAPAIAAGCPVILKPASATPLSTLALAHILAKAGLPTGSVSILPMNRETGNLLVTDERIQMLSFTGSPEVGWELKKQSGRKKVVLELGGNAGVIVCDSAHIPSIIAKCISGAFSYSGQICIHAQRFVVHENLLGEFTESMRVAAQALVYGDPALNETTISNMIDEENARRVESWVNEALAAGATLVCGGKRTGSYYEPTILTGTHSGMMVYAEEVFGPVICIEKYSGDISDAVNQINNSRYGLQCGIFTNQINELDYAFNHLEVGGLIHNDVPTLRFDQMPYGGIKDSGLGREGVKYAMHDMLEARVLVK